MGRDQRRFACCGFRDAGHPLHLHARDNGPLLSQRLLQGIREHFVIKLAAHAAQQYAQSTRLLYHLPATDREGIHNATEDQRLHVHRAESLTRKGENVFRTPLNSVDQPQGMPRRAGVGREAHTVIQLVISRRPASCSSARMRAMEA